MASDAQGIPLWRYETTIGDTYHHPSRFPQPTDVPGVWHALDAASVAARREAVMAACVQGANAQLDDPSRPWQAFAADAVLKALGLGGDDA